MTRPLDPIHALRMGCCACALLLAPAITGCSDTSSSPNASPNTSQDTHAHDDHDHAHDDHMKEAFANRTDVYKNIRGIITFMPTPDNPDPHMKIRHVHIPHFLREDGTVNLSPDNVPGMKSMIMGFPAAQGVDISPFNVDDKVEFTVRVNWGGSPAWEITEITKLDPDTEIDFTNTPAPPSDDTPDETTDDDEAP